MRIRTMLIVVGAVAGALVGLSHAAGPGESGGAAGEAGEGALGREGVIRYQPTLLVQLGVEDLNRSIAFYRDTMGFALESRNDALAWARIDPGIPGVTIGLGTKPGATGGEAISMNFGVGDIDGARATLMARGVAVDPIVDIPGVVRLADLKDPDGHRIRLAGHSPRFGADDGDAADVPDDSPLAPVAWLAGAWEGSHGERRWEEHWSAPEAGGIVGMFRMLQGEKVVVYELLMIEAETDEAGAPAIVHRLRHFGPEMAAWEEAALTYDLTESDDSTILFTNRGAEGPTYIRYTREGPNERTAWVGATATPSERGFSLPMRRVGN